MCSSRSRLTDLCRQIADLEYELEQELCDSNPGVKRQSLVMLQKRGDTRAAQILTAYLGPVEMTDRELEKLVR